MIRLQQETISSAYFKTSMQQNKLTDFEQKCTNIGYL